MGFLQKLYETYDSHADIAGIIRAGHEVLAPISHSTRKADAEITVDADGNFVVASPIDKKAPRIIIPVTEDSGSRTSDKSPHPLCETLSYLVTLNTKKYESYVSQLSGWVNSKYSHPKLAPILSYVKGNTIIKDLSESGIIPSGKEWDNSWGNLFICWRVVGLGPEYDGACWEDMILVNSFIEYYKYLHKDDKPTLCMITGKYTMPIRRHPKPVIPFYGNGKLISENKDGLNFNGGATVGYEASQKIHNVLKWLSVEQGVIFGRREFLCWNPKGKEIPKLSAPIKKRSDDSSTEEIITVPSEYKKSLLKALTGYKENFLEDDCVVILCIDSSTTGRLSVTNYTELHANEFLQKLYNWDSTCCWRGRYGIQSPTLNQIINYSYGNIRKEKGKIVVKTDSSIEKNQIEALIKCRIHGENIPSNIVTCIINNTSELYKYDPPTRATMLFTCCAVINKYEHDKKGSGYEMSLNPERKDRSYQYGRLLAVYERVESYYNYLNKTERETYAIRQQPAFIYRPLDKSKEMEQHLAEVCFPNLKPKKTAYFKKIIGEIFDKIHEFPDSTWNRPLDGSYLIGYYLQRDMMFASKKEEEDSEKEIEDESESE